MTHYHIHWSGKDALDWESFGSHTEAEARARQLMRPGEAYTIEERDETCARCLAEFKSTAASEAPEVYLNPKLKYPAVKYGWQQAVLEALMELSPELLPAKIDAAQRAISARLSELTPANLDEQAAIQDAMQTLRMLVPERSEPKGASGKKEVA